MTELRPDYRKIWIQFLAGEEITLLFTAFSWLWGLYQMGTGSPFPKIKVSGA
jgi:hypothetical protein